MTDLKTTFAGLSLRNPIIISSSGLTNSVGKTKIGRRWCRCYRSEITV